MSSFESYIRRFHPGHARQLSESMLTSKRENRVQLASLDKVIALLESIAMFYIAYPAAVATGKVLLQTAPPKDEGMMSSLNRALADVSFLVVHIFGSGVRLDAECSVSFLPPPSRSSRITLW